MTTSGTYSFSVSRDDIIRQAMLVIGKLDPYESPDAQQTTDCALVLNMMVKQWMGKADYAPGLKTWTRKRGHLFLQNNTGVYTIGPACATGWSNSYVYPVLTTGAAAAATTLVLSSVAGMGVGYYIGIELDSGALFWTTVATLPGTTMTINAALPSSAAAGNQVFCFQTIAQNPLFIETAVLRDQYLDDTPLRILTVQDYDMQPNKADPTFVQDPTAIYFETQLGSSYLYTDAGASQDVTKHIVLTYQEPIQDFNNPLDTPYYPQEWYLPLCLGLGKLIAPIFNRPWTPNMDDNFKSALAIAKNKDAERSSLFFQPGAED
jgi:hypothetical protein